ncbi:MAG: FapA family protein [Proteobacteria bacterium]|nr:FapA family protein [Pseudomonadota bacterium]
MDSADTYSLEQNLRLLDLALDCLFIYPSEREKIRALLEEKSTEPPGMNLADIFKQESLVSDEKMQYLLALDQHLQTQCMDQQFGQLAVANKLVSQEAVAQALHYQSAHFKKTGITLKIGEILVDNKRITHGDLFSILLTQNRIKDEHLLDALNHMGQTQAQKDAVNGRFGALAIKNKVATIEQVAAAMEIQRNERRTQAGDRFIGQILQETAHLSEGDILQVLLEQKQLEKRRLDLENALYTVQSEIKISKKLNLFFEYGVSKDGLEAFVRKRMEPTEAVPVYEVLIWLRRGGIRFGIVSDALLEDFIREAKINSQIIVAKGFPPKPCTHEALEFYFENQAVPIPRESSAGEPDQSEFPGKEGESQETLLDKERPQNSESLAPVPDMPFPGETKGGKPLCIRKNSLLAKISPGKEGRPGKNVFGYPIQPDRPSVCGVAAGSGVIKKGPVFIARIDGRPVLKNNTTLMVEPAAGRIEIKTITGVINNDTKEVYESVSVQLTGTLAPGAVLRCHSLRLHGSLLGWAICERDIEVKGDIGTEKTKDKGTDHRTGILCGGSVKASKRIVNSSIQTAGELLALNSMVVGSEVIAFKGMVIGDALKGEVGPSILQFGLKPNDKILAADRTLGKKKEALSILKKEADIADLTEKYKKERKEHVTRQTEQAILKNIVQIIETPDLYQHESLDDKLRYLYRLPEFSSVKARYLKFPQTETGLAFLNQTLAAMGKMSLENGLKAIREKIDPEPADETPGTVTYGHEIHFKARLAAFEREISEKSEEIKRLENEIKALEALRTRLGSPHAAALFLSKAEIRIKNKCEAGTIIKGKLARLVVENTLYNVKFREVPVPKTNRASISIERY